MFYLAKVAIHTKKMSSDKKNQRMGTRKSGKGFMAVLLCML